MKVFTTNTRSILPPYVHQSLGLPDHIRQGRVFVSARTKAAAFALLSDRGLAPSSIRDPGFRQAMGNDVDALAAGQVFKKPIVVASGRTSTVGVAGDEGAGRGEGGAPVVWVGPSKSTLVIGRLVPGAGSLSKLVFVPARRAPDAEPVVPDAPAAERVEPEQRAAADAEADDRLDVVAREKGQVLAALAENVRRVDQATRELARLRRTRQELALRARELDITAAAARALKVTPGRVSQLADEALVARATTRPETWDPGTRVHVTDPVRDPQDFPYAVVVVKPAGKVPPNESERWVWVRFEDTGAVVPVRPWQLLMLTAPLAEAMVLDVVAAPVSRHVGYLSDTVLKVKEWVAGSVWVWVNNEATAAVAEEALAATGYRVRPVERDGDGVFLVVTR